MSKIEGIVRGKKRPPRVVLYGPPGIGKTTFGAEAESPVIVTTEDGADNLPVDQFPKSSTWEEFLGNVRKVVQSGSEYKTIVLDTLNGATELAAQHICKTQFGGVWYSEQGKKGFNAFAQGWSSVSEEMRNLLDLLDQCRAHNLTVILTAHTGLHNVSHPSEGEYTKFAPDVDKRVWARVSKWSDIVLRADFDYVIQQSENKIKKGRAALGDTTRWMFSVGNAAQDAKTRVGYELPERLTLEYAAFRAALDSGQDGVKEEVAALWSLLDPDAEKKALEYLGVKKASDIEKVEDPSKIRAVLNRLRQIKIDRQAEKANNEEAA